MFKTFCVKKVPLQTRLEDKAKWTSSLEVTFNKANAIKIDLKNKWKWKNTGEYFVE